MGNGICRSSKSIPHIIADRKEQQMANKEQGKNKDKDKKKKKKDKVKAQAK